MDAMLMQMDPAIPGTSTLAKYEKQIELLSFSHNVPQGKAEAQQRDFTITKHVDEATPKLGEALAKATKIKSVDVILAHVDQGTVVPAIGFRLKDVVISSIAIGAANIEHPIETVTMQYKTHEWTFVQGPKAAGKK